MKKSLISSILVAALVLCTNVYAEGKVAVFDLQMSILNTDAAKSQLKTLENNKEYSDSLKKFNNLKQELISIQEDYQKNGSTWKADKAEEQRMKMEYKRGELDLVARKIQAARQNIGKQLLDDMGPKLKEVLDDIVKEEGIGLLLDKNVVVYADVSFDITEKVTKKLNDK